MAGSVDIISSCMASKSGPPRKGIDIAPTMYITSMAVYNISYAPTEATVTHQRVWSVLYNFGSGPYFIPWTSPSIWSGP